MPFCGILYEDASLLLCVKEAGLDSEKALPARLSEQTGGEIYCVHRLDRDAAGLMVYAKSRKAAAALSAAVSQGQFHKEYLAVVQGETEDRGQLRDLLYHDAARNKTYVVKRMRRGVREALLNYETLERREGLSLARIQLLTGRSHQIRVQFSSRKQPLVGDRKYGSAYRDCPLALWSAELSFPHPETGETLTFSAVPDQTLWPWSLFPEKL